MSRAIANGVYCTGAILCLVFCLLSVCNSETSLVIWLAPSASEPSNNYISDCPSLYNRQDRHLLGQGKFLHLQQLVQQVWYVRQQITKLWHVQLSCVLCQVALPNCMVARRFNSVQSYVIAVCVS